MLMAVPMMGERSQGFGMAGPSFASGEDGEAARPSQRIMDLTGAQRDVLETVADMSLNGRHPTANEIAYVLKKHEARIRQLLVDLHTHGFVTRTRIRTASRGAPTFVYQASWDVCPHCDGFGLTQRS